MKCILLFSLLLSSSISFGAISVAQCTSNYATGDSNGSVTASWGSSTTAGSLIYVTSMAYVSGAITQTYSDSSSQTYTYFSTVNPSGTFQLASGYFINSASITSIKVTFSSLANQNSYIIACEVKGVNTSTPRDPNISNPATSSTNSSVTSLTSGSLTTTNPSDILIFSLGKGSVTSGTPACSSGWVQNSSAYVAGLGGVCWNIVSTLQTGLTTSQSWSFASSGAASSLAAFEGVTPIPVLSRHSEVIF